MAAAPRALALSRSRQHHHHHHHQSPLFPPPQRPPLFSYPRLLPLRRTPTPRRNPSLLLLAPSPSEPVRCCVVSGGGGGGLADEFVSLRRQGGAGGAASRREFSALRDVLLRIEPLDTAVVGKGVSAPARDAMKRTISDMLGLLPSAQFDIWIRVPKERLRDILRSSIITGYTLWNAEYRMLLTKNFESSSGIREATAGSGDSLIAPDPANKDGKGAKELQDAYSGYELISCESLGDLSPAALSYIKQLESELVSVEKELDAQNKEKKKLERSKENNNNLLKYLRSLHPEMVCELSQPSSAEIEEIIRQLVQCTLQKTFDSGDQRLSQYSSVTKAVSDHSCFVNQSMVSTSRDHLAKLLFWCMLLGHHLRGLEYRLQLSCVVGLA